MEAVGHWLLFVCNLLGLEVVVGGESIGPFGTCTRLDLFFICVAVLLCESIQISTIQSMIYTRNPGKSRRLEDPQQ